MNAAVLKRRQKTQITLVRSYQTKLTDLERRRSEEHKKIDNEYSAKRDELYKEHQRELAELWLRQGRRPGPWMEKVLGRALR